MDGQIVYNTKLSDGDTYTLDCRGSAAGSSKQGYKYTVYDELYQEWALDKKGASVTAGAPAADQITSIQPQQWLTSMATRWVQWTSPTPRVLT